MVKMSKKIARVLNGAHSHGSHQVAAMVVPGGLSQERMEGNQEKCKLDLENSQETPGKEG